MSEVARSPDNPFPGLRSFNKDEGRLFFGRRTDIFELMTRLRENGFVAVVGVSGCGKSSLLRAGLIAALEQGVLCAPGESWSCLTMRPGHSPLEALASELAPLLPLEEPDAWSEDSPANPTPPRVEGRTEEQAASARLARVSRLLESSSFGLAQLAERVRGSTSKRLFLLVDQFEELFTMCGSQTRLNEEGRGFIRLLLEAIGQRALYVTMTMRTDYLGDCALVPELADEINMSAYLLPRLTRQGLKDAICKPVESCDGTISEALVNRLLNDANSEPDQLPVLQHALMRLWQSAARGVGEKVSLDLPDYQEKLNNSLATALDAHAEAVYGSLSEAGRLAMELIFREISAFDTDFRLVRRPTSMQELWRRCQTSVSEPEFSQVLALLRVPAQSFLMPPISQKLRPETMIDASHEALLRQWSRVAEWARNEARERSLGRQLSDQALQHAERERNASFLYRGAQLTEAELWALRNPDELTGEMAEFLKESRAAEERQRLEQLVREADARGEALAERKATLYLCAATQDLPRAQKLERLLSRRGFAVVNSPEKDGATAHNVMDTRSRITASHVFLYLLTRASLASEWCRLECSQAIALGKRVVSLQFEELSKEEIQRAPAQPCALLLDDRKLSQQEHQLMAAIGEDYALVADHTRLQARAVEWQSKTDRAYLLRGHELTAAEEWLEEIDAKGAPRVTVVQRIYLSESRKVAKRGRRRWSLLAGAFAALAIGAGVVWSLSLEKLRFEKLTEVNRLEKEKLKEVAEKRMLELNFSLRQEDSRRRYEKALPYVAQTPIRDTAAPLRELSVALLMDRANLPAAALTCQLLLSPRYWARPVTPSLQAPPPEDSASIALMAASFVPEKEDEFCAARSDGTLVFWKSGSSGPPKKVPAFYPR